MRAWDAGSDMGCSIPLCKLQDSDTIELFYGLHRGAWGVADLGLI